VISFTPQPLYPHRKSPWYPLDRRLSGPQHQSGCSGEEKISQLLLGLKLLIIQPIAQCYTTELSQFLVGNTSILKVLIACGCSICWSDANTLSGVTMMVWHYYYIQSYRALLSYKVWYVLVRNGIKKSVTCCVRERHFQVFPHSKNITIVNERKPTFMLASITVQIVYLVDFNTTLFHHVIDGTTCNDSGHQHFTSCTLCSIGQ
jgi:hypothetical protein